MTATTAAPRLGSPPRKVPVRAAVIVAICLIATLAVGIVRAATATPRTVHRAAAPVRPVGPVHWVSTVHPIQVGGMSRDYLLIRPAEVGGTKLPVLVFLQGRAVSPQLEAQRDGLTSIVGPAVLVYPAGYDQFWNAGACCGTAQARNVDDTSFLAAVIRDVANSQHDARPGPVLMAGFSNGGKMAFLMACAHPELVRAVASIGAVAASDCTTGRVSLLEIANRGDPELSIDGSRPPTRYGSYTDPTVDAQVAAQRRIDGCKASAAPTQTAGLMTVTRWASCQSGTQVSLALFDYPDHRLEPGQGTTPSAGQVIWSFFTGLGT